VPSCAEGGVLGVLPGIIGVIQATEAIKLITGIGEPLIGRFLIYDALKMKFRELKLRKDPECPVCGTNPTVKALIDYEQFCGIRPEPEPVRAAAGPAARPWEITPVELKKKLDAGETPFILDVREPNEYQINRIAGSTLIPLGELPRRYQELPKDRPIVAQCKTGARSGRAMEYLKSVGFKDVKNLKGGILAWIDTVDPSQPKY
jgi:adenylyltransferase/sulfurtransferase